MSHLPKVNQLKIPLQIGQMVLCAYGRASAVKEKPACLFLVTVCMSDILRKVDFLYEYGGFATIVSIKAMTW